MSEYQYYEFQTIDRALTHAEMDELLAAADQIGEARERRRAERTEGRR